MNEQLKEIAWGDLYSMVACAGLTFVFLCKDEKEFCGWDN